MTEDEPGRAHEPHRTPNAEPRNTPDAQTQRPPDAQTQRAPNAEPAEALAALVRKLREELTGVRTAMRNRAVIEQAKGVLVERLGVTPDQSFDHLVRLSQRTNIKLIEIAAAIVGTTAAAPDGPTDEEYRAHLARTSSRRPQRGADERPTPSRSARPPALAALQAQHQLISARVSTATSYDRIAEAICTAPASWPAPAFVVLTALEPDGAQRIIGAHQLPADVRSQWARIPPDPGLAAVVAVRDRTPIWLPNEQAAYRSFPSLRERPFPAGSVLAAPLTLGERLLGCLIMTWETTVPATADVHRYLTALADPVARRVDDLLGEEIAGAWKHLLAEGMAGTGTDVETDVVRDGGGNGAGGGAADGGVAGGGAAGGGAAGGGAGQTQAQVWLPSVLDTVLNPAALMSPVREDGQHGGGKIVDFRIEYTNAPARAVLGAARVDIDHATLLALYPATGSTVLLPALTRLAQGGDPVRLTDLPVAGAMPGTGRATLMTVHAVRLWDRILMVFQTLGAADLLHPQLLQAERVAQIGSFSYDRRLGEVLCSPQLYRMYHDGDRVDPVPLDQLAGCVHPDDSVAVRDAIRRTFETGRRLVTEFRGAGPLAGRRLRITAEPWTATDGTDAGNPITTGTGPGSPHTDGTDAGREITGVLGTLRDVTVDRAHEARLRVAEEALAAQRRQLETERRAAAAVRQALLPDRPDLSGIEGIAVSCRLRTTPAGGNPGDWYDALALPNGVSVLLLSAARDEATTGRDESTGGADPAIELLAAAATLRHTARAYAPLGVAPADILTAVDGTLRAGSTGRPATLVAAAYDPAERRLRWASAGPVAAIRYPAGRARGQALAGPPGPPIGTTEQARYHDRSVVLDAGDRVLFYASGPAVAAPSGAGLTKHADLGSIADLAELTRHPRACLMLVSVATTANGDAAETPDGGRRGDGHGGDG